MNKDNLFKSKENLDFKLLVSILALAVSITGLFWNIWNKFLSERKKLQIKSYKSKSKDIHLCAITLTNTGNKPIYIRRIEIEENFNRKVSKPNVDYSSYKEKTENKPLAPGDWRTIVLYDTKYLSFFDVAEGRYKSTKITFVDTSGKKYSTKWFRQNNLK